MMMNGDISLLRGWRLPMIVPAAFPHGYDDI